MQPRAESLIAPHKILPSQFAALPAVLGSPRAPCHAKCLLMSTFASVFFATAALTEPSAAAALRLRELDRAKG